MIGCRGNCVTLRRAHHDTSFSDPPCNSCDGDARELDTEKSPKVEADEAEDMYEKRHIHRSRESDDKTSGDAFDVGKEGDCSLDGSEQEPTGDGREGDANREEEEGHY